MTGREALQAVTLWTGDYRCRLRPGDARPVT